MSKNDLPIGKNMWIRRLAIVLFFILTAILIGIILNQQTKFLINIKKTASPTPTSDISSIKLPFPINKPYLGLVIIVYNFFGPVKEVKNVPEGMQLLLDIPNDNLPNFILNTQYTQMFKPSKDSKPTTASTADLKVGTKINVQMMYDLKLNIWRAIRVDIL